MYDGDGRAARQRGQLELRELDDHAVLGRQLRQPFDERDADVAAEDRGVHRVGGEDRRDERRGRRLALRAGDTDRRRGAQAQEQVRLLDQRRRARIARRPPVDEGSKHGAEARLGRRVVRVDDGRGRDQGDVVEHRRGVDRGPEGQLDRPTFELFDRPFQLRRRARVVDAHARAGIGEEAGEGDAAAREAQHGHRPVAQDAVADRGHRQRVRVDRRCRRRHRHAVSWKSGSDARNSVTPRSPASTATIQKRRVIFSSSQPPSSK